MCGWVGRQSGEREGNRILLDEPDKRLFCFVLTLNACARLRGPHTIGSFSYFLKLVSFLDTTSFPMY